MGTLFDINNIKFEIKNEVDHLEDIFQLYVEANWWKKEDIKYLDSINEIIKKSFVFVTAKYQNKIIGCGRAISDGISDAYIQDVIVKKGFRNKGIGKRIINKIIDFLNHKKISWIGLIAQPGTKEFYEKLGFKYMIYHLPMIYKK